MSAPINIAGMRSGRLVAIEPAPARKNRQILWRCRCDCGNERLALATSIRVGDTRSCGCERIVQNRHLKDFVAANAGNSGCWEWPGVRDKDGYGRTKFNGRTTVAHRAIYRHLIGEIPAGVNLCHRCDNPPCCNPDHIFLGTQKDNCQDAKRKDRHSRGERNGHARLTDDIVREIRRNDDRLSQTQLAHRYGIRQSSVWLIQNRKQWAHVQD